MMDAITGPRDGTDLQLSASVGAWLALTDDRRRAETVQRRKLAERSPAFTEIAAPASDPPGELRGLPVSIKDNIAVRGLPTRAGSLAEEGTPASADAPVVASLRCAGASIVGHTTMSEFAYAATGLDRLGACPANPADPKTARIPGGSSSGAAVSVADDSCLAAVGTDTAGSVRIPAALCGLVGYVPSQALLDQTGVVPLSPTLDRIGVITRSVDDCQLVTSHMAASSPRDGAADGQGESISELDQADPLGTPTPPRLRTLVPGTAGLQGDAVTLAPEVSSAIAHALQVVSRAGGRLSDPDSTILDLVRGARVRTLASRIIAHEAWAFHASRFGTAEHLYGEWVSERLRVARDLDPGDYASALEEAHALRATSQAVLEDADALVLPAVAFTAPEVAEVKAEPALWNRRLLELSSFLNVLGWCAVTVPVHLPGSLPVGLTLAAPAGRDATLLTTAKWLEEALLRERIS